MKRANSQRGARRGGKKKVAKNNGRAYATFSTRAKEPPPPLSQKTGLCFTCAPVVELEESLAHYLASDFCRTAKFDGEKYSFNRGAMRVACGGLLCTLKRHFYPHHKESKRYRSKDTNIKGSNKKQGSLVDSQIALSIEDSLDGEDMHRMTAALLAHFRKAGHTLVAAQVPVEIRHFPGETKVTQADLITRHDTTGELWLVELKTGFPQAFYRKKGMFRAPYQDVACTKEKMWQLQLHFTKQALLAAGVRIAHASIIQIHETKDKPDFTIVCRPEEAWVNQ